VQLWGSGDYAMRVWLDPQKVAQRGLTATEVVNAIREQNIQVAAGVIGASPSVPGTQLQLSVNARGRLKTEGEFGDIIVKTAPDGGVTYLRDIARVELAASEYGLRSLLDNKPLWRSLSTRRRVRTRWRFPIRFAAMKELAEDMPAGVEYKIVYDPTQFVRSSIEAVIHTLLEAIALVVIVVIVFLQTWRASIIPLIAVPVSIVGRSRCCLRSASRSMRCHCSGWCLPSGSWWTMRSWWWRTSNGTLKAGSVRAMRL
jgi:Cation/multidrug efflux pump